MFILIIGMVVGFVLLMRSRKQIAALEDRVRSLENALVTDQVAAMTMTEDAETAPDPIVAAEIPKPTTSPWAFEASHEPVTVEREFVAEAPAETPVPTAPATPAAPKPKRNLSFNFEDLFGRRLPIWAGGITLAIAGVLIAKYAIDAGMMKIFTPWVRVIAGFLFGTGLIAGAELASRNEKRVDDPRIRQALSGAGVATLYATVLVAANVYALIGPVAAFVALAAVTAAALALSIRFGAPSAVLGLAGGLAAPAMVGGAQPNVPLLAVYLGLTIAGLAGVSRMQRWAWLGIIALVGGAGWSLWMIVAANAFDTMASLSIGGFVLLLAVGLPMLVLEGPRAAIFRSATTLVGAAQLGLMVALGGFSMLNWGLFALLAAAGQWLNWRERGFAIVPTIGLVLSVALLSIWPDPVLSNFVVIGVALGLIHGLPLLLTMWKSPPALQKMVELCGLAAAVVAVPFVHYYPFFFQSTPRDTEFAGLSLAASLIPIAALVIGWARNDRQGDRRFALGTVTAVALLGLSFTFATPDWLWPIGIAVLGAATLFFGERARDHRIQTVAALFAFASVPLMAITGTAPLNDWARLAGVEHAIVEAMVGLRWSVLAAIAILFAARVRPGNTAALGQIVAAFLGYGAVAQFVPATLLPLIPSVALAGLALASSRLPWPRLAPASATLGAMIALWAIGPVEFWLRGATASIGGVPMTIDQTILTMAVVAKQLLAPAALIAFALWNWRGQIGTFARRAMAIGAALIAIIGLHTLYRIGFAQAIGTDFTNYGMPQRLVWEALLIGAGWLATRRPEAFARRAGIALIATGSLHAFWYTLLLHNPLWAEQSVGAWPLANWIAPAFGLAFAGIFLLRKLIPGRAERPYQLLIMALVTGFAWATLRQAFHGTLLVAPGVSGTEDILRSILAIALAVGFLLWGIRTQQRDWRIASLVLLIGAVGKVFLFDASGLEGLLRIGSFVALGFSLIGIGWLYSRQLTRDAGAKA